MIQYKARELALPAVIGGLLWASYGVFEMLSPWSPAQIWQGEQTAHVHIY